MFARSWAPAWHRALSLSGSRIVCRRPSAQIEVLSGTIDHIRVWGDCPTGMLGEIPFGISHLLSKSPLWRR